MTDSNMIGLPGFQLINAGIGRVGYNGVQTGVNGSYLDPFGVGQVQAAENIPNLYNPQPSTPVVNPPVNNSQPSNSDLVNALVKGGYNSATVTITATSSSATDFGLEGSYII